MRILAISDDWTHLIDRHGKQHVVQRGCPYPSGVAAPPPAMNPGGAVLERGFTRQTTHTDDLGCATCRAINVISEHMDGAGGSDEEEEIAIAWSLLASNADIGGTP